ncbi:MAG TPA: hypothetical protein PLU95_10475 [Syntrophales bacterium]|jgi:hypothetical protein|nr:hypothetical protein [Syntrophorhabdaceae bacterium]HPN09718.1 hypothetical protein [Syntrophales bacterium]HQM82244.1 hypothetical protein [Syntrophorhabdaceae bacterium]
MEREKLKRLAKNVSRGHGDAIAADKVIAQARDIGKVFVVHGTSAHRIQEVSLRENVLCVIDKPFHLTEGCMRLKCEEQKM